MPEVKHFAILKFNADVTDAQIDDCFAALRGMVGQIPGLQEVIGGPYDSPEGMNDGFTHGFIMTFDSPEARDTYLPHPIHEEVKAQIIPLLEKVVVFDFNV